MMNHQEIVRSENRFISIKEACRITSISRTKLWQLCRDGQFPRPVTVVGSRKAFVLSEINAWLEERIAERDAA
ncbi:MAG: AlpA family phage regulatory protein [Notoacmeibacter sp.]|nr:AlpA family phage regulatory protein [Notoacmeibacter sp.]